MFKRIKSLFKTVELIKSFLSRLLLEIGDMKNSLMELKEDYPGILTREEWQVYKKPINFLHDGSEYVGKAVAISKNNEVLYAGRCIGYGSMINNALDDDGDIHSTTRLFLAFEDEDNKIYTIEDGMDINIL
jgi:hypothetical protein